MIAFASNATAIDMLMAAARYDSFDLLTYAEALLDVSAVEFATRCYVKMIVRFDVLPDGATNEHVGGARCAARSTGDSDRRL
jgi:hypothetical protein